MSAHFGVASTLSNSHYASILTWFGANLPQYPIWDITRVVVDASSARVSEDNGSFGDIEYLYTLADLGGK